MTIVISGYIRVSAEKREQLLLGGRRYIQASRLEPGCVAYRWSADLSEPGVIYVFEQWADEASLHNHFQCSPYQNTLKMFGEAGYWTSQSINTGWTSSSLCMTSPPPPGQIFSPQPSRYFSAAYCRQHAITRLPAGLQHRGSPPTKQIKNQLDCFLLVWEYLRVNQCYGA